MMMFKSVWVYLQDMVDQLQKWSNFSTPPIASSLQCDLVALSIKR